MTNITKISIDGIGSFSVTTKYAHAIAQLLANSPDTGVVVPIYLASITTNLLIRAIKEVRCLTGMSLQNAKFAVDRTRSGEKVCLGKFDLRLTDGIVERFEAIGATVEIADPLTLLALEAD